MEWAEFSAALAAFLGAHVVPMRLRGPLVARLGRRAYVLGYSLLSLGLLYWLIVAAGRAPWVEIWPQEPWMRWAVNLAMPVAFLLAATGGMAGLMAAFTLWAGTHLLANGDLAHVLLFGILLSYALLGLAIGLRRGLRLVISWQRVALALLLWAGLFHLHPLVIGVSPAP
ncbi:NnrU family protein [Paracoccus limosus]|uniref:NnrU family protein n=1 Tax=Paracoccus limosus TaxID=913252 RepID=A0A844H0X5_9RHOB|nr:NnrU family protein [Paracoccus limosus]MTH34519.1 NnrU family protein [Paracoccus limosus]